MLESAEGVFLQAACFPMHLFLFVTIGYRVSKIDAEKEKRSFHVPKIVSIIRSRIRSSNKIECKGYWVTVDQQPY